MALASWPGLTEKAVAAANSNNAGEYSRAFYGAVRDALRREEGVSRRGGDKQGLVGCIKQGMKAASEVLIAQAPQIRQCAYRIPVPGLSRGKSPDYCFTNGVRFYAIEQKSVLRFNEFAEVFLEGVLVKKKDGDQARFAALFNYLHQNRVAFDGLCCLDGKCIVDHICVLIPDPGYSAYSVDEVDLLFQDIRAWLT